MPEPEDTAPPERESYGHDWDPSDWDSGLVAKFGAPRTLHLPTVVDVSCSMNDDLAPGGPVVSALAALLHQVEPWTITLTTTHAADGAVVLSSGGTYSTGAGDSPEDVTDALRGMYQTASYEAVLAGGEVLAAQYTAPVGDPVVLLLISDEDDEHVTGRWSPRAWAADVGVRVADVLIVGVFDQQCRGSNGGSAIGTHLLGAADAFGAAPASICDARWRTPLGVR